MVKKRCTYRGDVYKQRAGAKSSENVIDIPSQHHVLIPPIMIMKKKKKFEQKKHISIHGQTRK